MNAPSAQTAHPDPEQQWLANVYQHGKKQLTARAVITGMLIGMVMCLSNLYVVLAPALVTVHPGH